MAKSKKDQEKRLFNRREFLKAGAMGTGAMLLGMRSSSTAHGAEKFPTKAITIINESPQGGSFDRCVRVIEPEWERITAQPINLIFAPGAGGQIACTKIVRNPPDGYTLGINAPTNFEIMIHYNKPQEFGADSFIYLGTLQVEPLAIIVRKDAKWKNWAEMYEDAKKGPVNLGVGTPKTYYHIAGVILNEAAGTKFNFVHYGGGGASRTALLQGEVAAVLTGLFSAAEIFDRTRGLLVFAPANPIPETFQMATSREVIPGKTFPEFLHPTTFFLPGEVQKKYPERYDYLVKTFSEVVQAPKTKELAIKAGFPAASWQYWTPEKCKEYEKEFVARLQTLKIE